MNKIIANCLLGIIIVFLTTSATYFLANDFQKKYTDCGKIISKPTNEVSIKRGSKTVMLFLVDFKQNGLQTVEVDYTTYFTTGVYAIYCHEFTKTPTTLHGILMVVGTVTFGILCLIIIALISMFMFENL